MAELLKSDALVLRAMRWQESSKIVDLYTREHGFLKVVAKGALRAKSPFRGSLETLNHVEVINAHKPGRTLQTLASISLLDAWLPVREDIIKTGLAFGMLELLQKLFAEHEPLPAFFDYLIALMKRLEQEDTQHPGALLWHLLVRCADVLGFSWNFSACLQCRKSSGSFPLMPDASGGGFLCGNCISGRTRDRLILQQEEWHALKSFLQNDITGSSVIPGLKLPGLERLLLRHLAIRTDMELDLKSLKWYV